MAGLLAGGCLGSNRGVLGDSCEPCRYAHDAGPHPEAKRQDSARKRVVQSIGREFGKAHLRQQRGPQFGLEERRRFAGKTGCGRATRSMQCD